MPSERSGGFLRPKRDDTTSPYFTAADVCAFTFCRIPKALINDTRFRAVSTDAKLLYGLLLDCMGLSERNGWPDALGQVYLYYIDAAVRAALC